MTSSPIPHPFLTYSSPIPHPFLTGPIRTRDTASASDGLATSRTPLFVSTRAGSNPGRAAPFSLLTRLRCSLVSSSSPACSRLYLKGAAHAVIKGKDAEIAALRAEVTALRQAAAERENGELLSLQYLGPE